MNAKQQRIIEQLEAAILRDQRVGQEIPNSPNRYEVKLREVTESDDGKYAFLLVETGLVGDEGTYASIFARSRRLIMVTPCGGIRLLNARSKRKSRGFFNAVHALTKNN